MRIKFHCPQCRKWKMVERPRINRAKKDGLRVFCGRKCSGLARRSKSLLPLSELRRMKAEYDKQYRAKNLELLRVKKAAYYQRTRDPEKERRARAARMHLHIEYCRQPEYRAYKHEYDLKYRANKLFGQFADAALILRDVEIELDRRMTWVERHQANGTLNKSTQRKREYAIQTGSPYPR